MTFYEGQTITAEPVEKNVDKDIEILAAYKVYVNDFSGNLKIRMKAIDKGQLYLSGKSADYEKDGSYIVFEAENGSEIVYIKSVKNNLWIWMILVFILAVIITAVFIAVMKKKKKKNHLPDNAQPVEESQNS